MEIGVQVILFRINWWDLNKDVLTWPQSFINSRSPPIITKIHVWKMQQILISQNLPLWFISQVSWIFSLSKVVFFKSNNYSRHGPYGPRVDNTSHIVLQGVQNFVCFSQIYIYCYSDCYWLSLQFKFAHLTQTTTPGTQVTVSVSIFKDSNMNKYLV